MWALLDLQRMLFLKVSVSVVFLMAHSQMFWLYQNSQERWCWNFTLSPKVTESPCYPLRVGCTPPIPWVLSPVIGFALSLWSKRDKGSLVLLPPDYYIIIAEAFVDVPPIPKELSSVVSIAWTICFLLGFSPRKPMAQLPSRTLTDTTVSPTCFGGKRVFCSPGPRAEGRLSSPMSALSCGRTAVSGWVIDKNG